MVTAFADGWAAFAGNVVARSLALFALCGLMLPLLRRASASTRSFFWRLHFVALAALPVLALLLPPLPISAPLLHAPQAAPRSFGSPVAPATMLPNAFTPGKVTAAEAVPDTVSDVTLPAQDPAPLHRPFRVRQQRLPSLALGQWRLLFLVIWSAGVLLALCRVAASLIALRQLEAQTEPAADALAALAAELAQATGSGRRVRVRVATTGAREVSPLTWGCLRPVLLLPGGAAEWPVERLRAVLLHELAHVGRNDWCSQLLADVVCACYWFHPLVWAAARQLRRENELACDDRVLACGLRASDYAAHLLDIVRLRKGASPSPAAAISMAQPSMLEARLRALLDERRARQGLSPGARATCAILLSLLMAPLAAVRVVAKEMRIGVAIGNPVEQAALSDLMPGFTAPGLPGRAIHSIERHDAPIVGQPAMRRAWPTSTLQPGTLQQPLKPDHQPLIAWGKASGGLQVGLERTDGQGVVIEGQHIAFRIWLRNMTAKSLEANYPEAHVAHDSYQVDLAWNALVANDKEIMITPEYHVTRASIPAERQTNITIKVRHNTLSLRPGEARNLPDYEMQFLVTPIGNSAVTEPTIFLAPGRKTVEIAPMVTSRSPGRPSSSGAVTGKLPLEVVASGNTVASTPNGLTAKPEANDMKEVEWGAEADGLQAGIRRPGKQKRFQLGERVPLECYLRNITGHKIALTYAYRPYMDELPVVQDASGAVKKLQSVILTGLDCAFALILEPGESVVLWLPAILLGDQPQAQPMPGTPRTGLERWPFLEEPTPGDYLVRQSVLYHITTVEEVEKLIEGSRAKGSALLDPYRARLIQADGKTRSVQGAQLPFFKEHLKLVTGDARFTIVANAAPAPQNPPDRQKPEDHTPGGIPNVGTTAANGIYWGATVEGLQAGLRVTNDRKRYAVADLMELELLIRNAGTTEIKFPYERRASLKMTMRDRTNANVSVQSVSGGRIDNKAVATLKPGESIVIEHAIAALPQAKPRSQRGNSRIDTGPGQYRTRTLYTVQMRYEVKHDGKSLALDTGWMPFEVLGGSLRP